MEKSTSKKSNQESKQLTRECIRTALIYLLKDTPFEHITVTSIIQRAGVSRAGFYRNYSSKEAVLDELAQITYEGLATFIMDKKYESDPHRWYLDLFQLIQDHAKSFELLIQIQIPKEYLFRIETPLKQLMTNRSTKEYYRYIATASSLKEIILEWFLKGMKESPEEMADFFVELYHS